MRKEENMKTNKIIWPVCPNCKILINSYAYIPASALMENSYPDSGKLATCPDCKKEYFLFTKICIEMTTEKTA